MQNLNSYKTSLRDYIRVLFYWRWVALTLFLVVVITSVAGSFLWPPTYRGVATLLVEQPQKTVITQAATGIPAVPSSVSFTEEREQLTKTQSEIIKSRFILGQVVDELALDRDKSIKGKAKREKAVNKLFKRVFIKVVRDTNLIRISVEDRLSRRSSDIANSLSNFYVEWASENKRAKAKGAYSFLGTQSDEVDRELRQLENSLQRLKKSKGIMALDEQTKLTVEQLGIFDTDYNRTISDEEEAKARVKEIKAEISKQEDMIVTSTDITTNPVVNDMKLKLIDLEINLTELKSKYTDRNPLVISGKEEIEQVKQKINNEVARIFGKESTAMNPIYRDLLSLLIQYETDLNAQEAKRKALKAIRDEYSKRLINLSDAEIEYTRLLRRIKGKEALYITLLEKQGEAGLAEALESSLIVNVKMIDPAVPPIKPVRPKKLVNTILGMIIGLISGVSAAFMAEYWDHSLKTVGQVARFVKLPVLGVIPGTKEKRVVPPQAGTRIAESYSSLRTSIIKICREKGLKSVLIASANNQEGKSVVSANLAGAFSSISGHKVLLVDMNLRRPALYKYFESSQVATLSDILRRQPEQMFTGLGQENVSVVTVGELAEDPAKVLTSRQMKYFLNEARTKFNLVLLDTSSIIPYTDSSILAQEVDAVILVIKAGSTRREVVERAKSILNVPPEKLIGVILNSLAYVIPEKLYKYV